jgi:hypothetical protein
MVRGRGHGPLLQHGPEFVETDRTEAAPVTHELAFQGRLQLTQPQREALECLCIELGPAQQHQGDLEWPLPRAARLPRRVVTRGVQEHARQNAQPQCDANSIGASRWVRHLRSDGQRLRRISRAAPERVNASRPCAPARTVPSSATTRRSSPSFSA